MLPARGPRDRAVRLLVIDSANDSLHLGRPADLAAVLSPGDLLVANDAATFPASLRGRTASGAPVELRLTSARPLSGDTPSSFRAVVFGDGDWRTPTEHRPAAPELVPGQRLWFDADLTAVVEAVDARASRLCDVRFEAEGPGLWRRLYRAGRPVQYAYVRDPLRLSDVQNPAAGRPVAVESPSAGRFLTASVLVQLGHAQIEVASLTHAAGLSSTGDPTIDEMLPLPEAYELPLPTVDAIGRARRRGGRVVAIGTTVVRALEGNAAAFGDVRPGPGVTDLRIGAGFSRRVVDAIVSGLHDRAESHFEIMTAFAPRPLYDRAIGAAEREGLLHHEFGDICVAIAGARAERAGLVSIGLSAAA